MGILWKSNRIYGYFQIKPHQIQWECYQNLMDTNGIFEIKSYQNQWESYQNLMVTHRICQIKSHQIQWQSWEHVMGTMDFFWLYPLRGPLPQIRSQPQCSAAAFSLTPLMSSSPIQRSTHERRRVSSTFMHPARMSLTSWCFSSLHQTFTEPLSQPTGWLALWRVWHRTQMNLHAEGKNMAAADVCLKVLWLMLATVTHSAATNQLHHHQRPPAKGSNELMHRTHDRWALQPKFDVSSNGASWAYILFTANVLMNQTHDHHLHHALIHPESWTEQGLAPSSSLGGMSITIIWIIALITKVCQCPEPIVERHGFPHHPIAYEINHQLKGWVADCCWSKKAAWLSHKSQAVQLPMLQCYSIFSN